MYIYYFGDEDNEGDVNIFHFLEKLNSETEIDNKIEFLVSKMVLYEHEDSLTDIIENYI